MRPIYLPFALLAIAGGMGTAMGATASAQQESDAKCLLLSNVFAKSPDSKAQQASFAAHFFYLGRLRGEIAPDKLQDAILLASKSIVPALSGTAMKACAAEVGAAEVDAERAGKQIQTSVGK